MICNRTSIQGWEQFTWGTGAGARSFTPAESITDPEVSALDVFPNPSRGSVNINVADPLSVTIIDASTGRSIWSSKVNRGTTLSNLRTGSYVVIQKNDKGTTSRRVVVE